MAAGDSSGGGGGPPGGGGPGGECNESETEVTNCGPGTAYKTIDPSGRETTGGRDDERSTPDDSATKPGLTPREASERIADDIRTAFDPLSADDIEPVDLHAEAMRFESGGIDLANLTQHDPKSTARASTITYNTRREFVWGLDYIDELIAIMWTGPLGDVYDHVLQDANYNIIAHAYANTNPATGVRHQFRYHPYGQWTYENAGGTETVTTNISSRLHATHGWQGLWFDQESGLVYIRGRYYDPLSGRFLSRDPNGQAVTLTTALRSNAQTPAAFVGFWPREQYADSANPYLPCAANPNNRRDPSGLSSLDYFEEADELELDWYGQRLYTLGAINEGAKWASLGLELTLDIAGGLLGIDVFESVMVLADGGGGFWDSINIVMAVAPFGHIVKAADKIHSAAKFARKAKGAMLAVDKAHDLARFARRVDKNSPAYKQAVREAEQLYPKKAGRDEWHHVVPKYLGGPVDGPKVKVNAAYHQWITNEFQRKWKYGQDRVPNEGQLRAFMREVYDKFPLPE